MRNLIFALCFALCTFTSAGLWAAETDGLCGGWTVHEELDAEALADFQKGAAQVKGYTLRPISCSTQVVAGLNYCFLCSVKKNGRVSYGALNLYRNLRGEVEVSDFRLIPMKKE